jgi:hypothetical protein
MLKYIFADSVLEVQSKDGGLLYSDNHIQQIQAWSGEVLIAVGDSYIVIITESSVNTINNLTDFYLRNNYLYLLRTVSGIKMLSALNPEGEPLFNAAITEKGIKWIKSGWSLLFLFAAKELVAHTEEHVFLRNGKQCEGYNTRTRERILRNNVPRNAILLKDIIGEEPKERGEPQ